MVTVLTRSVVQRMRRLMPFASSQNPASNGDDDDPLIGSENSMQYEELMRDSVECPSCKGLGRIPKADETKLVALIPYGDKRLRPRRTTLYVCIAVAVCLLACGMLVFFLIPRDVKLESSLPHINPNRTQVDVKHKRVVMNFWNTFNVDNENYFQVRLGNVTMAAFHNEKQVAESRVSLPHTARMRSNSQLKVQMNLTLEGRNQGYLADLCYNPTPWMHEVLVHFQLMASVSYLLHSEQVSIETYQYVNCTNNVNSTALF